MAQNREGGPSSVAQQCNGKLMSGTSGQQNITGAPTRQDICNKRLTQAQKEGRRDVMSKS